MALSLARIGDADVEFFPRVMGQNRVFIIPAWDLKPSADAVRRIEETPLVQNIYTRTPGPEGNITPKQRSLKRKFEKVEAVEKENEVLKKSLQYEKDSLRRWEAEWERERGEYQGRIETQEMVLGEVGWGTRRAGEKGGSGMGEGKGEGVEKGEGKEGEQGNGKGKGEEMGAGKDNGKGKEPEKETGNDGRKVGGDDGGKDGGSDGGDDGSDDGSGGRKGKGKGKGAKNAKKKKQTRAEKKAEEGKAQAKADDDAFRQGRKTRKVAFMAECHRKCKARFAEAEKAAWADEYKRRGENEYAKKQRGGPALKGKEKASAKDGQLKRAGMGEMVSMISEVFLNSVFFISFGAARKVLSAVNCGCELECVSGK